MKDYKYVGKNIKFKDVEERVTGRLKYAGDLNHSDMLYSRVLLSEVARGRIKSIDSSKAEELPGVVKVYTYENTPQNTFNSYNWYRGQEVSKDEVLLTPYARFVGDRVAAVVARDKKTLQQALDLIEVEYEEEEPIIDPREGLASDDSLHGEENPFAKQELSCGDVEGNFAEIPDELIFEDELETPKIHHATMENHVCFAYPKEPDRIAIVSPCQLLFSVRMMVANMLDLRFNQVHAIKAPVGGSFGAKQEIFLEPLCAFMARDLDRPVKLEFKRRDSILATRTRSKIIGKVKTAVDKEGKIRARDIDVLVDAGGYTSNGNIVSIAMAKKVFRLYRIENQRYRGKSVHTNTPIGGACRGYGSPQIHTLTEINIDRVAKRLDMDPVDFRLKNLIQPYDKDPTGGPNLGNAQIIAALKEGAEKFDWYNKRNRKEDKGRYRRGIGVACCTHGNGYYGAYHDFTGMTLRMYADGSLLLNTGLHELGNATLTAIAQIAGEVLEIDPGEITVLEADTDLSPYDIGAHASRGTYVCGMCAFKIAEKLKEQFLRESAKVLNTTADQVEMEQGEVWLKDAPQKRLSYGEMAARVQVENQRELFTTYSYQAQTNPGSYGAHFAEVEVDTFTGLVKFKDYVAAHDVGKAINPSSVEGQIHGGVQMGIGMALCEEITFNDKGQPLNTNFSSYHLVNAPEMPKVRVSLIEEGGDEGPYGAKSIGEIATVPVTAAVVNAVNDALDIKLNVLPMTPARILEALNEKEE
ncbi:molybdopterin-dependent oxidoreductase [Natroniella acetigena]|uniref:xanthine dehydrogenase family protein molybdopterin-binding subunit n=1 Tax=Natroniella acetigena TaxID=52004 RepID=UPI00200A186C|nr:molybdopterin-dependent oxidoreductase [Natroniella acetigena]